MQKDSTIQQLEASLVVAQKREHEAAELERLRKEAEEKARLEREETIRREAAEQAKRDAEAKAQAEIDAAARREASEKARAEEAERQRIETENEQLAKKRKQLLLNAADRKKNRNASPMKKRAALLTKSIAVPSIDRLLPIW